MNIYCMGLEITEKECVLAVVAKQKAGWRLLETASWPLIHDGNLAKIFQQIRRTLGKSRGRLIIGIPYNQILMKEINLDASLKPSEIYKFLQQQTPLLFGKAFEHWRIDFEPTGLSDLNPRQKCFRVIAAPRETITSWQSIGKQYGLIISAIDIDIFALIRLLPTLKYYKYDQPQAILWVKTHEALLIAAQQGRLIYVKRAAYSCTQSIASVAKPLLQFFHGLYPQYDPIDTLLFNESPTPSEDSLKIESAFLNPALWQGHDAIKPSEFCSLGLAMYGH